MRAECPFADFIRDSDSTDVLLCTYMIDGRCSDIDNAPYNSDAWCYNRAYRMEDDEA